MIVNKIDSNFKLELLVNVNLAILFWVDVCFAEGGETFSCSTTTGVY